MSLNLKRCALALGLGLSLSLVAPSYAHEEEAEAKPQIVVTAEQKLAVERFAKAQNLTQLWSQLRQRFNHDIMTQMLAKAREDLDKTDTLKPEQRDAIYKQLQTELPQIERDFAKEQDKIEGPDFISELTAQIYLRDFSADELNEYAAIMESPTAKKFAANQAKIMADIKSMGEEAAFKKHFSEDEIKLIKAQDSARVSLKLNALAPKIKANLQKSYYAKF
ncbi:MAG: DUF2059 domain-containing protein, partial [Burkholderiales bacterium]|nr:DUF2059 domain-containing protein [Burkholderiales bacterium]